MDSIESTVLAYLRDLIARRSVNPPGLETEAATYVFDWASSLGGAPILQEVRPGRHNVVAGWKFGEGSKNLLLHAHLDVVPPTGTWTRDPFDMYVSEDKAYGRGACDTKGSLAAMMTAVETLLKVHASELAGTVTLVGVVGEETGGIGTQHFAGNLTEKTAVSAAVVGEPTSLNVVTTHRGLSRRLVTFTGRAGHPTDPRTVNAIYKAARVTVGVEELNSRLSRKSDPVLGSPCVSATVIHGGVKDNVVPDRCELSIDRRRIPGEDARQLDREIEEIMARLREQGHDVNGQIEMLGSDKEPTAIGWDHPFVQLALNTVNAVTGEDRMPGVLPCATDMPFLMGAGIPSIVLGPGSLDQAHVVDEFVEVGQLVKASRIYADIARRLLA